MIVEGQTSTYTKPLEMELIIETHQTADRKQTNVGNCQGQNSEYNVFCSVS